MGAHHGVRFGGPPNRMSLCRSFYKARQGLSKRAPERREGYRDCLAKFAWQFGDHWRTNLQLQLVQRHQSYSESNEKEPLRVWANLILYRIDYTCRQERTNSQRYGAKQIMLHRFTRAYQSKSTWTHSPFVVSTRIFSE